jgi:hypothetical protein
MMMLATLGKTLLKSGAKKIAKDKLLNRKKKKTKKKTSGKEMSTGLMNREVDKKGGALAIQPTTDLVGNLKDFEPVSDTSGESDIVIIRKQVIQVKDILKDSYSAKKEEREEERKARQQVKRETREEKLEKPKVKPKESKGMKVPNLGLGIGNFFAWLAFGIILNKLMELMPALQKIFGVLKPIADFIGGVFNFTVGLVTGFIDKTYAGIEKLEKAIEAIGGEGAKELFEKFGKLFTQVLNGALIAALIGARVGLFNRKPKIKQPKRSFSDQVKRRRNLNKRFFDPKRGVKSRRVRNIRRLRKLRLKRVKDFGRLRRFAKIKQFLDKGIDLGKNIVKTTTKVAQTATKGIKTAAKTATPVIKSAAKTATPVLKAGAKSGLKAVSGTLSAAKKIISPIVKKIPFIGALIDFALNYFVFKEPLGRSAFMAIGAGLGAWIGGAIGTLIPVPFVGTAIGSFLGGVGGDKLGGFIYDGVFGNKENKKDVSTLEKDGVDDKIKEEKTLTNRFDIETGKSYINNEEVSANEYNKYLELSTEERLDKYGILKGHSENILPNDTQSKAAGLDTHPSYAQGGMMLIENTTTYIQPVEV